MLSGRSVTTQGKAVGKNAVVGGVAGQVLFDKPSEPKKSGLLDAMHAGVRNLATRIQVPASPKTSTQMWWTEVTQAQAKHAEQMANVYEESARFNEKRGLPELAAEDRALARDHKERAKVFTSALPQSLQVRPYVRKIIHQALVELRRISGRGEPTNVDMVANVKTVHARFFLDLAHINERYGDTHMAQQFEKAAASYQTGQAPPSKPTRAQQPPNLPSQQSDDVLYAELKPDNKPRMRPPITRPRPPPDSDTIYTPVHRA